MTEFDHPEAYAREAMVVYACARGIMRYFRGFCDLHIDGKLVEQIHFTVSLVSRLASAESDQVKKIGSFQLLFWSTIKMCCQA